MRIGIDARMYGTGFTGIGRYTYELIRHLGAADKKNEYVIFLRKEAYDSFIPPTERFSKVLADFPHYSFAEQISFLKLLNSQNLDLMHFAHFNAPLFYKRPYVVTIHDLTLSFFPGKKMNNFFRRLAYRLVLKNVTRKAKRIIAVSENTKKDLIKLIGVPEERIQVIYHGVNPDFAKPSKTSRPDLMKKLGLQKPYFLYTGVWRDHKNITGLIEAFNQVNAELGHQYSLVITGRHNPSYHEIPDLVRDLHLEEEVHLVGLVSEDDLRSLYQYALAYVYPSFYEGFGLPPLEAMQCSTPVMASNQASIPEVCGEGNALYFDPYREEDIREKLRLIATDGSLRQRLVNRGLERIKMFDWKKTAEQTLEVYNMLSFGS